MKIHAEMPVWPGDEPPRHGWNERIDEGGSANVSHWTLGCHTGTHVDAPSHFREGANGIEHVGLERLVGRCEVAAVEDQDGLVTRECLERAWPRVSQVQRLLLRTRNSGRSREAGFDRSFVALDPSAAELAVERGVGTVGVDYLSVERFIDEVAEPGYEYPVHHRLLDAGVVVIEGLDLRDVAPGSYRLVCLPLLLVGSEAAPARAVLEPLTTAEVHTDVGRLEE